VETYTMYDLPHLATREFSLQFDSPARDHISPRYERVQFVISLAGQMSHL